MNDKEFRQQLAIALAGNSEFVTQVKNESRYIISSQLGAAIARVVSDASNKINKDED